jgi:pyruvate kinase
MQGAQILRNEAYLQYVAMTKDEAQRRRWTFYEAVKIVCTIGPATSSTDQIRRLILEGVDVARLNFSHGDHNSHREIMRRIRQTSRELGKDTGILRDLAGPKIRLCELPFKDVDFVALSFVRHERDLEPIQEMLAQSSNRPLLIAKIETPLAASWALKQGLAQHGDRIVVTAGVPVGKPGSTNLLRVIEIE